MPTSGNVGGLGTNSSLSQFSFTDLPLSNVDAGHLSQFDTAVLLQVPTSMLSLTAMNALSSFVTSGGKLIIYDSDATDGNDYSWLPAPAKTGQSCPNCGATTGTANVIENNTMVSADPVDGDHFIATDELPGNTDSVGDSNVMISQDSRWFVDIRATNNRNETGAVHTYATVGSGLMIYNGFDTDAIGSTSYPSHVDWLGKIWLSELRQGWDPDGLPHGTPVTGKKFVYVALGDSYQSGEGAGNSLANTEDYLTKGYENGSNYPPEVGSQQNTYTDRLGGNACHRALGDYAKLNRDRLKPGAEVVLVDVTCSGATIEPSGKPAIVGATGGTAPDPNSQVTDAIARLAAAGLRPSDVDLVTVGMGGNDAKFGEIVEACILPNVVNELLRAYPKPPREIDFIADRFFTCQRVDEGVFGRGGFHTDQAIQALPPKEVSAQGKILGAFPTARVLQVDYPNLLPAKKKAPGSCAGFRKGDLDFARQKVTKIDKAISQSVATSAQSSNGRIQLVEELNAFGDNALCPSDASATLANGINQANLKAEIRRLLNLDGNGDAEARKRMDQLVADYNAWKKCAATHYNPFGGDCDVSAAFDKLKASAGAALDYLANNQSLILANLMAPPGPNAENIDVRFDRSRGLFHPNASGHAVQACNVLAVFNMAGTGGCATVRAQQTASAPQGDTFNGAPVGNAPLDVTPRQAAALVIGGFAPGSTVSIAIHSEPVSLGSAVADGAGMVRMSVTLPDLNGGVHLLDLEGVSGSGAGVTKRVLVRYPGRPQGNDSYATYLCCFAAEPSDLPVNYQADQIDIVYLGDVVNTLTPDEDGGVLVEVPLVDPLTKPGALTIQARSRTTGKTLTDTINPLPSVAGLWATGTGRSALEITGLETAVTGRIHSESALTLQGLRLNLTGGVEYVTTLNSQALASTINPAPTKVAPGGAPVVHTVAEFRPGGQQAVAAGSDYHAIDPSQCANGVWRPTPEPPATGVVYVPCAVEIFGLNSSVGAVIAAEGPISVTGSGVTVDSGHPGLPSLVSGASGPDAIRIVGANVRASGALFAPNGGVQFIGLGGIFKCGAVASTIRVLGARNRFVVDGTCRAD